MVRSSPVKTKLLTIRVEPVVHERLVVASRAAGVSLSEFMLSAALSAAVDRLDDGYREALGRIGALEVEVVRLTVERDAALVEVGRLRCARSLVSSVLPGGVLTAFPKRDASKRGKVK